MDITLRKANAIQDSIRDAINSIRVTLTIDINEFQDVQEELQSANTTAFTNDHRREKLLNALYKIRGEVGQANASSGINLKLSDAAFIDKRIIQLEDFSRATPKLELFVINGKLDRIRNAVTDSTRRIYTDDSVVRTSVLTKDEIAKTTATVQHLKKQKQKINDEILALNISTTITLSDEIVETLTKEGIL